MVYNPKKTKLGSRIMDEQYQVMEFQGSKLVRLKDKYGNPLMRSRKHLCLVNISMEIAGVRNHSYICSVRVSWQQTYCQYLGMVSSKQLCGILLRFCKPVVRRGSRSSPAGAHVLRICRSHHHVRLITLFGLEVLMVHPSSSGWLLPKY